MPGRVLDHGYPFLVSLTSRCQWRAFLLQLFRPCCAPAGGRSFGPIGAGSGAEAPGLPCRRRARAVRPALKT